MNMARRRMKKAAVGHWISLLLTLLIGNSLVEGAGQAEQFRGLVPSPLVGSRESQHLSQQQVIVPGGFQHLPAYGNYHHFEGPSAYPSPAQYRNDPSYGHYQLRETGREAATGKSSTVRQPLGNGEEIQYEYYDDYGENGPSKEEEKRDWADGRTKGKGSSSFPEEEEEAPGPELAFNGRSVHPQPSQKNLPRGKEENPHVRSTDPRTNLRSRHRVTTRAPIRSPANRLLLSPRPQKHEEKDQTESDDEYTVEYVNGEDYAGNGSDGETTYYENSEEKGKDVKVSVSKKTSTTTPAPFTRDSEEDKNEDPAGVVISVATTKSVSSGLGKGDVTTPKVTFSRATGSSIVVASVQTSRSVEDPTGLHGDHKNVEATGPEYYEEEYTYPDNYPLTESKTEKKTDISPSPTESIMDKLDRVQSDLVNGVLNGLKPNGRNDEEKKETSSTTTSPKATTLSTTTRKPPARINAESIQKGIKFEDVTRFLPPDYLSKAASLSTTTSTTTAKIPSSLKPSSTTPTTTTVHSSPSEGPQDRDPSSTIKNILKKVEFKEISLSSLLPKDYKPPSEEPTIAPLTTTTSTTTTEGSTSSKAPEPIKPKDPFEALLGKIKFDDVSALLPKDYKEALLTSTTESPTTSGVKIPEIKFKEVSTGLLPLDFTPGSEIVGQTTEKSGNKLVFPTRPGGPKYVRLSTTEPPRAESPLPQKVTIQTGWPTRKMTEFTGWPTSSTEATTTTTTTTTSTTPRPTTTTTTTTTTTPPPKRSPVGYCDSGTTICKMEATLRIISGVRWKAQYAEINSEEWKHLEKVLKRELDGAYRSSGLAPFYRSVEIEGFNKGSVLVDYFVILADVDRRLSTAEVRASFHAALFQSSNIPPAEIDKDVDREELRLTPPDERLMLGRYIIDPLYTDFKVRNETQEVPGVAPSEGLIPQWGIAVIVIGLASLMFVIIFGVTVLVNRHKSSKKKNAVSLTQEMLSEFNKSHLGVENYGVDDLYNMDDVWNDKQMDKTFDRKPKANPDESRSSNRSHGSGGKGGANYNIYDSWKTEWNGYYYNGGNYYDRESGGPAPAGRRRSDYDTNF